MSSAPSQHTLMMVTRHALLVMLICYLPHFATAPWWLFLLVLSAIGYRLIADYYGIPLLNAWIRFSLVVLCMVLLKIQYGTIISSGFFVGFLLTFIGLKTIETHTIRDLKVLTLCNFYLIFSALIVTQELWIIIYMLVAVVANLSLMLKLSANQASLRHIGSRSIKQVLIAIPLSILLFYIFPRIANPLWQVPSLGQSQTGFSEKMSPGSIIDLFSDDSTALRVTFHNKPILNGYWRGLILSFYNGISWNPNDLPATAFAPLPNLPADAAPDYEVILEPHQKKWLFYLGYPAAGAPDLLFLSDSGLISKNKEIIDQRFAYQIKLRSPPYQDLTPREFVQNTQFPKTMNPRIRAWSREQFARLNNNPESFIAFLRNYINQQPYWYTLSPPSLPNSNQQMDNFWFDTRKGFCEHYASAVTLILRSAGIPARVIVGYQGGEWNPVARYMTVKQSDAHAWLEYWQKGVGWKQFDPTFFIAAERIDQQIIDAQSYRLNQSDHVDTSDMSWLTRTRLFLESAQFFTERWLLFYNQETQSELLSKAGLGDWRMGQLLQAAVALSLLFLVLFGLVYQWRQKRSQDPLLTEYHRLQKEFRRFNVPIEPSSTLKQQCHSLSDKAPDLAPELSSFLSRYEELRLKREKETDTSDDKKNTVKLFKNLRLLLNKNKPTLAKKQG
jgi:protein-glutamine gamma-glutamyltransferase